MAEVCDYYFPSMLGMTWKQKLFVFKVLAYFVCIVLSSVRVLHIGVIPHDVKAIWLVHQASTLVLSCVFECSKEWGEKNASISKIYRYSTPSLTTIYGQILAPTMFSALISTKSCFCTQAAYSVSQVQILQKLLCQPISPACAGGSNSPSFLH